MSTLIDQTATPVSTAISAQAAKNDKAARKPATIATVNAKPVTSLSVVPLASAHAWNASAAEGLVIADIQAAKDAKSQELVKRDIKLGVIARDLAKAGATECTLADITVALAVLNKTGKTRTDAEARAEKNARTVWSRLLHKSGVSSFEARGTKSASARKPVKTARKVTLDKGVYIAETFKDGRAFLAHMNFVTKALSLTIARNSTLIGKKKVKFDKIILALRELAQS